jgi:hypothetical protein
VNDDQQHQPYCDARLWQGDSVQVAFDTGFNAVPGVGYDDDDVEVGLALCPDGSMAFCYEPVGDADMHVLDLPLAIARVGEQTCYEVLMPWERLGHTTVPAELGMAMIINHSDGDMRTWTEWGSGFAGSKQPWRFCHIAIADQPID